MSDEEVVEQYDTLAQNTVVGTNFLMEEIRYRETSKMSQNVVRLTLWVTAMTGIITVATIVNVLVFLNDSPTVPGFLQ